MNSKITLGPNLFHWPAEQKRDFYFKMADESCVDTVYLGEVVCSKRAPFFEKYYSEIAERLQKGGKRVVYSGLSEVMIKREREMIKDLADMADDFDVEVNDASALLHIAGRKFRAGQYLNTYNEETLRILASKGAHHVTLPAELPATSIVVLGNAAKKLKMGVEAQVFGRVSLALSARCYHARAYNKVKDSCEFVCEKDADGMTLETLRGENFLSINGIQTISYTYLNLIKELEALQKMGVSHFRLSPHSCDMVKVAEIFKSTLDKKLSPLEALKKMEKLKINAPFSNGFYHGKSGHEFV